jgi:hypothetical protein
MDLSGIISISGRPGLFKVVAQAKNSIIVESLIDKKRFPAYSADRISALDDISIYTHKNDKPLKDIFTDIYAKTEGKAAPSHKEDFSKLIEFLSDILPNYDEDRVYPSDIKKLFQWFNLLINSGNLKPVIKKALKEKNPAKNKETKDLKNKVSAKKASIQKNVPAKKSTNKDDKLKPSVKKQVAKKSTEK